MRTLVGKLGDEILIGPHVTLSFLKVVGDNIHVGIDAPENWNITKGETEMLAAAAVGEEHSEDKVSDESPYFPEFA